jgi:glutathione S-transferase
VKLHGYWRSTSSCRLRIAVNLKGIEVEHGRIRVNRRDMSRV